MEKALPGRAVVVLLVLAAITLQVRRHLPTQVQAVEAEAHLEAAVVLHTLAGLVAPVLSFLDLKMEHLSQSTI